MALLAGLLVSWSGTPRALAQTWDREAVYAAHVAALQQAIAAHPQDPQPLVALATFYLKPLAARQIEAADGKVRRVMVPLRNEMTPYVKDVYAVPWVFRGDPELARPLLKRALALQATNAQAIRALAMLLRMKNDLDGMRPYMEAALRHQPLDLDMCRLFLDHRTALARSLNDQAAVLRTSRVWEEDRADGRYRVTQNPSDADLARAHQLDAQAQQVRRQAIKPLEHLVRTLKHDPQLKRNPVKKSTHDLANAIYYHWIGELGTSAGAAKAALDADPTSLDALDYLVDLLRGTHTQDKLAVYKAILDRWSSADSTPVIRKPKPLRPKR
jgi:tetratricopeptide (TPR) repeat protein